MVTVRARSTLGNLHGVGVAVPTNGGLSAVSDAVEEVGVLVRQAGSARLCSAMRNFSFLLGFMDGSGLNRSLKFSGGTLKVK